MRLPITRVVYFVLCALTLLMPGKIFAQADIASKKLPARYLKLVVPKTAHAGDKMAAFGRSKKNAGNSKTAAATSGLPGVDSLENWSDQFVTPGYDFNGSPQSVWPYTMVGTPPQAGITTHIQAPFFRAALSW